MVVADLAVVDYLFCMDGYSFPHGKGSRNSRHQPRQGCCHVFRQKAAVCSGISDEFLFVKALRIVQGLLCSKPQQTVGIPLERRQIIELRRLFVFFFAFYFLHHRADLLSAVGKQSFRILFLRESLAGRCAVALKCQRNCVKLLRGECSNSCFSLHGHRQCRGHNTPNRQRPTIQA